MIYGNSEYSTALCGQVKEQAEKIAELTRQLAEARKDSADADSMIELLTAVIENNDARWEFLHTINQDAQGFEWCVLRVKWENGRISEAWQTNQNLRDLDAAIKAKDQP